MCVYHHIRLFISQIITTVIDRRVRVFIEKGIRTQTILLRVYFNFNWPLSSVQNFKLRTRLRVIYEYQSRKNDRFVFGRVNCNAFDRFLVMCLCEILLDAFFLSFLQTWHCPRVPHVWLKIAVILIVEI